MCPLVRDRNKRRCTLIILDGELVDELQSYDWCHADAAIQFAMERTCIVTPVLPHDRLDRYAFELLHDALDQERGCLRLLPSGRH